ncbi:MAG: glycosyltransferase [Mycobacterium sp.]|nr:glycosyltransferase [Mycobacterium sp.]
MKFVLAAYGTRGDVEPSVVVGRELQRRGHDVRMAVPPDSVAFTETAGLTTFPYGLESQAWLDLYRDFWTSAFSEFWRVRQIRRTWRELWAESDKCWVGMNATLTSIADGADLLLTGQSYQEPAANVAEFYDIPFATLYHVPMRPNGQAISFLPAPMSRGAMTAFDWVAWRLNKKVEDAQRRELGLPKANRPPMRRITDRGSLEIQGYDAVCFPGLAQEWAGWADRRPFVGTLTMELATTADDEVAPWIAKGRPPICFGFGSMPVESPADTVAMIASACAELGERALICAGWSDFRDVSPAEHVKVVGAVNYATVFPACRAIVHHGGSGTTAASLRAGVPTLILSMDANQTVWGGQLEKLKVGATRRFSATDRESLVSDLRRILAPDYAERARSIAAQMTTPAESRRKAADVAEAYAKLRFAPNRREWVG